MAAFPLEGIRVADFTQVILGPHMVEWLAVMGADVIKIESKARPDSARQVNPYLKGDFDPKRAQSLDIGIGFTASNYSKKCCTLNLKLPKAVELAKKIVSISDVVVDNFSKGVMERLGLGYDVLKEIKPDIIMLSASATGSSGPLSDILGYAPVMDAWGGLDSITGYLSGPPDGVGNTGWTDLSTAQYGAFAILVALEHHRQTGEGQFVDLSMMESVACRIPEAIMDYVLNKRVRQNAGNREETMAPHDCYPCKGENKWVAIAVSNQKEWLALCQAMDNPAWCQDEKFSDELSRWKNQDELYTLISQWTKNYTPYEVMDILQKAGVAAAPTLDIDDLYQDPHLRERGFFIQIDQPGMEKTWPSLPFKQTATFKGNYQPAPHLGQHNDYVFRELLGMPEDEIKRLMEEKVIF